MVMRDQAYLHESGTVVPCFGQSLQRHLAAVLLCVLQVSDTVVPWFKEAAHALLESTGSAEIALAKALAKVTGAQSQAYCGGTASWCSLGWQDS